MHKAYFNASTVSRLSRRPNVVASRHTIEHVPDPAAFLSAIHEALGLGSRAWLFIETPCIAWIVRHRAMQDAFYEHCSIFTALALRFALETAGFCVDHVRHVFGGRYLWAVAQAIDAPGRRARPEIGLDHTETSLADYIAMWRERVAEASANGPVAVWGDGAKGVTFCHLIDTSAQTLGHAIDINPGKQGLFLPGTGIPVYSPAISAARKPRTVFVMNPNYLNEIASIAAMEGIDATLVPVE